MMTGATGPANTVTGMKLTAARPLQNFTCDNVGEPFGNDLLKDKRCQRGPCIWLCGQWQLHLREEFREQHLLHVFW